MAELKIAVKKLSRRHVCAVPGCRERETLFISRRNDVNGTPLYLCPKCIKDIYGEVFKKSSKADAKADKEKSEEAKKITGSDITGSDESTDSANNAKLAE